MPVAATSDDVREAMVEAMARQIGPTAARDAMEALDSAEVAIIVMTPDEAHHAARYAEAMDQLLDRASKWSYIPANFLPGGDTDPAISAQDLLEKAVRALDSAPDADRG